MTSPSPTVSKVDTAALREAWGWHRRTALPLLTETKSERKSLLATELDTVLCFLLLICRPSSPRFSSGSGSISAHTTFDIPVYVVIAKASNDVSNALEERIPSMENISLEGKRVALCGAKSATQAREERAATVVRLDIIQRDLPEIKQ